jgi:hypothetical protein
VLIESIETCTRVLFHNLKCCLQTCDENAVFFDRPLWKHEYHMLHSLDRWFINPTVYDEPVFQNLSSQELEMDSQRNFSQNKAGDAANPLWIGKEPNAVMRKRTQEDARPLVKTCSYFSGLNDIDTPPPENFTLTEDALLAYYDGIKTKIFAYLAGLEDEQLSQVPAGCKSDRLTLIMSQFRHLYAHLGNINAVTIMNTGNWPYVGGHQSKNVIEDSDRVWE